MKTLTLPALLISIAIPAHAETALDPDALAAAFPPASEGFTRSEPEYEVAPSYAGEKGKSIAHYTPAGGGMNGFEATLYFADLGLQGGKMYQEFGADYLKGTVSNETQKSITVKGLPGLVTDMGYDQWQVETFLPPRLHVTASCRNATQQECSAFFDQVDLAPLKMLSETR